MAAPPTPPSDATPAGPPPVEGLDFEPCDLASARASLEELPEGIQRMRELLPDYWLKHRRPPCPSDRMLDSVALAWLLALPAPLQPTICGERYPRVLNSLAAVWADPQRRHDLLDALIHDRRGGRRGFPPEVAEELRRLAAAVGVG